MSLDLILKLKTTKFIIFSDSLSVLTLLQSKKFDNPLIIKLLCKLQKMPKEILLCWIPSHIGISRNDQADKVVRSALSMVPEKRFCTQI